MPAKSASPKDETKKSNLTPKLPNTRKINFNFLAKINITYILFALLIIAAFLLGVLVTKVQYLEKGIGASGNTNTIGANELTDQNLAPQQPTGPVDVAVGSLPALGNEDAPVTIIEFSDFECPFCGAFFTDVLPQLKTEYIDTGKAKLYFRHFPLTSIHPNAQLAHEASECANDQGQFWGYHDILFENQNEWASLTADTFNTKLTEYATTLGLNSGSFQECLDSGKFTESVNKDLEEGSAAGVDGTPATFVDGYLIVGAVPYEQFKAQIEAQLENN